MHVRTRAVVTTVATACAGVLLGAAGIATGNTYTFLALFAATAIVIAWDALLRSMAIGRLEHIAATIIYPIGYRQGHLHATETTSSNNVIPMPDQRTHHRPAAHARSTPPR